MKGIFSANKNICHVFGSKFWHRSISTVLCIAMIGANIGGSLTAFAAAGTPPLSPEEQTITAGVTEPTVQTEPLFAGAGKDVLPAESQPAQDTTLPAESQPAQDTTLPAESQPAQDATLSTESQPAQDTALSTESHSAQDTTLSTESQSGQDTGNESDTLTDSASSEAEEPPLILDEQPVQAETGESETLPESETAVTYTLHLTHYLRFTVNGEGRNVQAQETLELTEADFEAGQCDLSRFAYDARQLTVTEALPLSIESFDESHEGGARIVYAVADGWQVVPVSKEGNEGTFLRDVFQGQLTDYEFIPANVVSLTIDYQYSKTGGLFGISPNAPETIQTLVKEENGEYVFDVPIKAKSGFRIVLNPAPLDAYLIKQPPENATPEELQQMLNNGDFNGNIAERKIYAYQEKNGVDAEPNYNIKNETYSNIYSTEYNKAWNDARIRTVDGAGGYEAMAISGDPDQTPGNHGANELINPHLRVTLTQEQLNHALENGLSITVNYRRNATWYKVKHWVPTQLSNLSEDEIKQKETATVGGVTYVLLDSENLQGRVGALTKAAAKTEGDVFEKLTSIPFSQELIKGIVSAGDLVQNAADETNKPTEINIYYKAADSYRVIFDTDYAYIPRQQVDFGYGVDFSQVKAVPQRKGYQFAGWQYLQKGAQPDANGEYSDNSYIDVPKDNATGKYMLKVDADLLSKAKFKTTDGVSALHLYPKWTPDKTHITVVLWTEDLDGLNDVQAVAEGGNVKGDESDYYSQKYKGYEDEVKSHEPVLNNSTQANENYSNAGSFTMQVDTGSNLVDDKNKLLSDIYKQVEKEFNSSLKATVSGSNQPIDFYEYFGFEVMHENNGAMDYHTTANADGKTIVYVYFTRKIYTLKFHYYGEANGSQFAVATGTHGYSYAGKDCYDSNGNLIFNYPNGGDIGKGWKKTNGILHPVRMQ